MPSKKKKTPAKPPSFNQSPTPQTPSKLEIDSEEVVSSLKEASCQFPSFIGKTAFIGQLTDAESDSKRRSSSNHVWLSESSMLSSSLSPGSLVSVSLASYDDTFPLSPISSEFSEFEHEKGGNKGAGNYFVIATVFPSSKVLKNEVQLSLNVSYSMGCPSPGRTVFIYPLHSQLLSGLSNGNDRPCRPILDHSLFHNCKCLHLELVTFVDKVKKTCNKMSSEISAVEAPDAIENEISSSPLMPLYQSKLGTPTSAKVTSSKCDESSSNMPNWHGSDIDSLLTEGLRDETTKQVLQACVTSCLCSRVLILGNFVTIPILSKLSIFRVVGATNKSSQNSCSPVGSTDCVVDIFLVSRDTKVDIHPPISDAFKSPQKKGFPVVQMNHELVKATVEEDSCKLGGLEKEYVLLKNIILSTMNNDLSSVGLRPIKGVLIHGPPGTGKTSLARLCARDAGVNLFSVNAPEIIGQYFGESEKAMNNVFDSAVKAAPSVVFIDELDAIAPARKDGGEDLSKRMVATLLHLMDGISRMDGVLVIAATNRPDVIEPALRRSGRFEREIEIGVPSSQQRFDILCAILSHMDHSLSHVHIQQLSMDTHGFVGADLDALCNEAALMCIRRYARFKRSRDFNLNMSSSVHEDCSDVTDNEFDCTSEMRNLAKDCANSPSPSVSSSPPPLEVPRLSSSSTTISEIGDNTCNSSEKAVPVDKNILKIVFEDFEQARFKIKPSAMREVTLEVPKVKWQDVGGQREVKAQLKEALEWPQDSFERIGSMPPAGVLMFGPPGCSKTLMARAVASEAGLNFLAVKGPELFSKWVGESEKAVRSVFAKARANAPSIIFFDEFDGLANTRGKESDGVSVSDRVISQLLVELDGLHQRVNVTVIAATNRPDKIDPALLRPGRFDRVIYVGPPNESDRLEIFRIHLRKTPCSSDVDIKELACRTAGYTGADISSVIREAALGALKEDINASEVRMQHFKSAIRDLQPTDIHSYKELSVKFQRVVPSGHSAVDEGDRVCSSSSNFFGIWNMVESFKRFFTRSRALDSKSASNE